MRLLTRLYGNISFSGIPVISGPIKFSLNSSLTTDPLVFTLACISTGGPATTVTWTRGRVPATGATSQTVTDMATATYSNKLTVTGRLPGNYVCTVTNSRSTAVKLLLVEGMQTLIIFWCVACIQSHTHSFALYVNM